MTTLIEKKYTGKDGKFHVALITDCTRCGDSTIYRKLTGLPTLCKPCENEAYALATEYDVLVSEVLLGEYPTEKEAGDINSWNDEGKLFDPWGWEND